MTPSASATGRCGLILALCLCTLSVTVHGQVPGARYREVRREIDQNFKKDDYAAALTGLQEAERLMPDNPRVIYLTALAYALLHQKQEGLQQLDRLVQLETAYDLNRQPAFAELKGPEFDRIVKAMEKIEAVTVVKATQVYKLEDTQFLPEGIAYEAKTGDLFLASIRKRKIIRVDAKGKVTDFITPHQDGIWGVSGIGLDKTRRILWACSTAFEADEAYTEADKGHAALFGFHLADGKLVASFPLKTPGDDHFCDDLTVAPDGTVYVSDSAGYAIHKLAPGAKELTVVMGPEAGLSPQGSALSPDSKTLFFSNYSNGIYAIDLASGKVSWVKPTVRQSLAGIDGLVAHGTDLIAIQNGIGPSRVVELKLSADKSTITALRVLEEGNPAFGEPTLGTLKGDTLLFVANNPLEKFLDDKKLDGLPAPIVLQRELQ